MILNVPNPGRALLKRYGEDRAFGDLWPLHNFQPVHAGNLVIAIAVAHGHTLKAMMELTMSLPFSFKALTAFFLETKA